MMTLSNYDKIYLGNKAKELKFNRDTLEKVTRLYDILRFINTNPLLRDKLALKGGTAINFTMFNLPRLSVDIDLDFMDFCSKEEMLEQRELINDVIKKYMISEGYILSPKSKTPHILDSFVYRYVGLSGNYDNVKIEINYSLRTHIDQSEMTYAIHPYFSNDFHIHRLSIIEIFASKINALLTRAAARDLYDIYSMIKSNLIKDNQNAHLRKSVVFYFAMSSKEIENGFNFEKINRINERMIKRDLKPVLSNHDQFNLKEAKIVVKNYISNLLNITKNETKFINFFVQNQYEPKLLFSNESIIKRIEHHPMALWRTKQK
jgi:predicted nucleotidyltransferase component of viral defense system